MLVHCPSILTDTCCLLLGLRKISYLARKNVPVRFIATMWNGTVHYIQYDNFQVANSSLKYKLKIQNYNVSQSTMSKIECNRKFLYHNGMPFSTFDQDNDFAGDRNCAKQFSGGWWHRSCNYVSANGPYCNSSSCGSNVENMRVTCIVGNSYSMKKFEIQIYV